MEVPFLGLVPFAVAPKFLKGGSRASTNPGWTHHLGPKTYWYPTETPCCHETRRFLLVSVHPDSRSIRDGSLIPHHFWCFFYPSFISAMGLSGIIKCSDGLQVANEMRILPDHVITTIIIVLSLWSFDLYSPPFPALGKPRKGNANSSRCCRPHQYATSASRRAVLHHVGCKCLRV